MVAATSASLSSENPREKSAFKALMVKAASAEPPPNPRQGAGNLVQGPISLHNKILFGWAVNGVAGDR